jgi:hypothetical protein
LFFLSFVFLLFLPIVRSFFPLWPILCLTDASCDVFYKSCTRKPLFNLVKLLIGNE